MNTDVLSLEDFVKLQKHLFDEDSSGSPDYLIVNKSLALSVELEYTKAFHALKQLKKDFKKYGQHRPNCNLFITSEPTGCDCGFLDRLREVKAMS